MRSLFPSSGNPWPPEMTIRVEDDPHPLLELLWVREAYGLQPAGDLPPRLRDTPDVHPQPVDRDRWEQIWPRLWEAVVRHLAAFDPDPLMDELNRTSPGSSERERLLAQLVGPSVRDGFGDDAMTGFHEWQEQNRVTADAYRDRMLRESPEHRAVERLVPAWRAGLTRIITVPCRGEYTRVLGSSALLITDETRADPDLYNAALDLFPG